MSSKSINLSNALVSIDQLEDRYSMYNLSPTNDIFSGSQISEDRFIKVVENYLKYYASSQSHTAKAKRLDLFHFVIFLSEKAGSVESILISDWTMQSTIDFIEDRFIKGEAPATVSRRLATLKHLGRTLAERVPGFINPAREVKSPSLQITRPKGLSNEEIGYLREVAHNLGEDFVSIRSQFVLELFLRTGLRADEVRNLILSQLEAGNEWIRNVRTKGKKFRSVYIDSELRIILITYLKARDLYLIDVEGYHELKDPDRLKFPLIVSKKGGKITDPKTFALNPKTLWKLIYDIGLKAKESHLGADLHPHRLRHTFAHGLLDSSKDIRLVAQALGHSDVRTTMRYTERTEDEIRAAIDQKVEKFG